MRISVVESDPGYVNWLGRKTRVTLDGVDVSYKCHTADDEENFVIAAVTDSAGGYVLNELKTAIAEEILYGDIVITQTDCRFSV